MFKRKSLRKTKKILVVWLNYLVYKEYIDYYKRNHAADRVRFYGCNYHVFKGNIEFCNDHVYDSIIFEDKIPEEGQIFIKENIRLK